MIESKKQLYIRYFQKRLGSKMKKCGLVIRVSTDRQASNKEGSLKNQLQRLNAHIKYKNTTGEENWIEAEKYILKAVSGKDSIRSKEFTKLFEDIKMGRINTVLCTALDRISRSVKDFLNFFEFINKYDVEFVCLKQNYDTTSPQGKFFITVMMALAEFEREQTSERNKAATLARAERGLWNGSRLLGYDLDPDKKGYLILNKKEKTLINFTYDAYLKCGSILKTAKILNNHGFRTKEYSSRRGNFHSSNEFGYSPVKYLLTNYAYIGKKEINKKKRNLDQKNLPENERYRIVDGVWESLITKEKFYQVQDLIKKNHQSKHNNACPVKHNYILNSGLLWCTKCRSQMEGRSGTGKFGKRYYYYRCKNNECKFKVPAEEIEKLIINRIKELSKGSDLVNQIVKLTNSKLQKELPQLKEQKTLLKNELKEIKDFADNIAYSGVSGRQFRRHPDTKPVTSGHLIDSIFINIILNQ